jgi:hypothetical protein
LSWSLRVKALIYLCHTLKQNAPFSTPEKDIAKLLAGQGPVCECLPWSRQSTGIVPLKKGVKYNVTGCTFAPGQEGAFTITMCGQGLDVTSKLFGSSLISRTHWARDIVFLIQNMPSALDILTVTFLQTRPLQSMLVIWGQTGTLTAAALAAITLWTARFIQRAKVLRALVAHWANRRRRRFGPSLRRR